jgi:hypothetical protein
MFSSLAANDKNFSKTENNFFKSVKEKKKKNTFLICDVNKNTNNNTNTNNYNNNTPKNIDNNNNNNNKINLNNSFEILKRFSIEKNDNKISSSKNAEKIKRLKNLFEKSGKFLYEDMDMISPQRYNNLQGSFNKKFIESEFYKKNDKRIFNDNDKENNINSDLLRLELMNLNCYTQKDIKSIKGIERFSSLNNNKNKNDKNFINKNRRTISTISLLDIL